MFDNKASDKRKGRVQTLAPTSRLLRLLFNVVGQGVDLQAPAHFMITSSKITRKLTDPSLRASSFVWFFYNL
jgi:hypothetical protein